MKSNYIVIQGWMASELNLAGNDLLVFALIYGFCQDGESEFTGSIKYVCDWLNCTRPTAMKALQNLVSKGLILKESKSYNNVIFNRYKISLEVVKKLSIGSKETLQVGSKETLPNNTILDNTINKIDIKTKFEIFWSKYPSKVAKDKCLKKFEKLAETDIEKILETLDSFLAYKMFDGYTHPLPLTYLNQKRWQDEIPTSKPTPPQAAAPRRPFTG